MFYPLLTTLTAAVSGEAARALVECISQWHRIQATPTYREAATWVHSTLREWGLDATLEAYPVREGSRAWGEPLFDEWSCSEGWLDLLEPGGRRRLADYHTVPLALIPRSIAADGVFELAVVEGGSRLSDYAGLDVRGKLVLSRSAPALVQRVAVEQLGAAGVIFDGMRSIPDLCPPGDLPDAIQYVSWWWWGGEARCFGFALSPRAGAELRLRQQEALAAGAPLRLQARVRAELHPGTIEAVSALIPGSAPEEEVLLMAHLCHPAPCANDNASGAAAVMELARTLKQLIDDGRLARPRRSMRFLWVPEMTGTYLYFAHHEELIPRTVAALNLDMVGEDQERCGSVNTIVHTSDALPSFAGDLLEALRDGLGGPGHSYHVRGEPVLFRQGSTPASSGSDHYILADPSVGIPTPLIIEWPDRFYHTTADVIEHVSPATLARNMTLAGSYTYFLAAAGAREAAWLAGELQARFTARLASELQSAVGAALAGLKPHGAPWDARVAFRVDRHSVALASLRRLDPAFDPLPHTRAAATLAEQIWQIYRAHLAGYHAERTRLDPPEEALTPRRRYRGPLSLRPHLQRLPAAERAVLEASLDDQRELVGTVADIALYWADGRRSLGEILDLVELETEVRNPPELVAYMRALERLGLVEL